jgi:hypothetical protein
MWMRENFEQCHYLNYNESQNYSLIIIDAFSTLNNFKLVE